MILNKENVSRACFNYGYVAVAYLLMELENAGRYEECAVLYEGLVFVREKYDLDFGTRYNNQMIDQYKKYLQETSNKPILNTLNNIPQYAQQVKEYLSIK